jgi:NifB/MoaA-like Fe-S oxidoreductase
MMEDVNDGKELEKTISELYLRYPSVKSLAVVPVGLTSYREGLYPLKPVSAECALKTIDMVEEFNKSVIESEGEGFVWCADEFYVLANRDVPENGYYGSYPQIENGVGMIRQFITDADDELLYTPMTFSAAIRL